MKHLLFLLFFPMHAIAQEIDSLTGPVNLIDGVLLQDYVSCDYDSIARLHSNSMFVITDSGSCQYSFQPGETSYLEIILTRKNCKASDMSNYEKWIIDLSATDENGKLVLSPDNTVYLYWNQWISPAIEQGMEGVLIIRGQEISLELHAYLAANNVYVPERVLELRLGD